MFYNMKGKAVIITAPSGAGKTTIVKHLLGRKELNLAFSVSACTRPMRDGEIDGKDYYFMTPDLFKSKIDEDEFMEWEEVYKNCYYGTLKNEVKRLWDLNYHILFDVDVKGALSLKKIFLNKALAVFIIPPSIEVLKKRLEDRSTESAEKIQNRINKAIYELKFSRKFDVTVLNDKLAETLKQTEELVGNFLNLPNRL
jgi:guanylate kinase